MNNPAPKAITRLIQNRLQPGEIKEQQERPFHHYEESFLLLITFLPFKISEALSEASPDLASLSLSSSLFFLLVDSGILRGRIAFSSVSQCSVSRLVRERCWFQSQEERRTKETKKKLQFRSVCLRHKTVTFRGQIEGKNSVEE